MPDTYRVMVGNDEFEVEANSLEDAQYRARIASARGEAQPDTWLPGAAEIGLPRVPFDRESQAQLGKTALGMAAALPAVLDPIGAARSLGGGVLGSYLGGKAGRFVGGDKGESVGRVVGGFAGGLDPTSIPAAAKLIPFGIGKRLAPHLGTIFGQEPGFIGRMLGMKSPALPGQMSPAEMRQIVLGMSRAEEGAVSNPSVASVQKLMGAPGKVVPKNVVTEIPQATPAIKIAQKASVVPTESSVVSTESKEAAKRKLQMLLQSIVDKEKKKLPNLLEEMGHQPRSVLPGSR